MGEREAFWKFTEHGAPAGARRTDVDRDRQEGVGMEMRRTRSRAGLPAIGMAAIGLLALLPAPAAGQETPPAGRTASLSPDDDAWEFTGDSGVGMVDGVPTLLLRTGHALRRDVAFEDGTIEFDYRGTDDRAFLGVIFRTGEDGTAEDVYLRLHKSKQPDALQYTPDYGGRGQWQLFHGPGATANLALRPDTWTHVKVEVAGDRAAVTVGEADEPQLVIPELVSGRSSGFVGWWANQPGADAGSPLTAAVRNIRITHGQQRTIAAGPRPSAPFGLVRAWGVSTSFLRDAEADVVTGVPTAVRSGPWTRVVARPDGLTPLEPHVERPEGDGVPTVVAGIEIDSDAARTVRLDLGFSDDASVFLNDRLLYAGHQEFSANFPRRQGLVGLDQASLYLPLEAGRNTILVAVSEIFGGWAVMGRIAERDGLTVRALAGEP